MKELLTITSETDINTGKITPLRILETRYKLLVKDNILRIMEKTGNVLTEVMIQPSSGKNIFSVSLSLPDSFLVLSQIRDIKILPGSTVHFAINVPLWHIFRLNDTVVDERRPLEMSKTWVGDPVSGDPAYTLIAEPLPAGVKSRDGKAYTDMTITNNSKKNFNLKGVIIYTQFMNLYENEAGVLITDRQHVTVSHAEKITVKLSAPQEKKKLLFPKRQQITKDQLSRFTAFLKKASEAT